MLRNLLLSLLLPLVSLSTHANELTSLRNWTGVNGKVIRATYAGTSEKGTKVMLMDTRGKLLTVAISNLIESDRELIASKGRPAEEKPVAGKVGDFRAIPPLDRDKLPIISQGDFGSKSSDCVPSSFCNFLLWWDQEGILEIPKKGDFDKKAEWIHTKLARYCGTRNTAGTNVHKATEGFLQYFNKDIADLATLKIHVDYDLTPENIARYTTGELATMFQMTIRRGARHDSGHWVALVEADPDGKVVFHTWGARFEGTMKVLEENPDTIERDGQSVPRTVYEIVVENKPDLPEWFRNSDRRFILDPANWDSIYVLRPYIYTMPGSRVKAPEDPLFKQEVKDGARVVERPGQTPIIVNPTEFAQPEFPYPPPANGTLPTRKWKLENGRTLEARIDDYAHEEIAFITTNRKTVKLPLAELGPAGRAVALIDGGTLGDPMPVDRISLSYRLTTGPKNVTDLRIDIEGPLARVQLMKPNQWLTIDTSDGSFVIKTSPDSQATPVPVTIGRVKLLDFEANDVFEQLHANYAKAGLKHGARYSGRDVRTKMNAYNSDEMTLTLSGVELPALPQALACLQSQEISGYRVKPRPVFFMRGKGSNVRLNQSTMPRPFAFLGNTRLLPVEAKWKQQRIGQRSKIEHSLTLLGAEIPDSFPEEHFSIPAEARTMDPGNFKSARP